ncbi:MAG: hypothetical protein Kow0037_10270 [Calditrichia bacterium]
MLKAKKKITKRELKEDKFVTFTFKARDWIEENAKTLIYGGIALLVLIVLISFYTRSKQNANIQANAMLGEAQLAMSQNDSDKAERLLLKLVEDYSGVTAAGQGCYVLAKLYWEKEEFAKAETYFQKYIDDYADDELLTASALAGLADCYLHKQDVKGAAELYERAAKVNKDLPLTPSFLYSAARAYMESEDSAKAASLAKEIIKNYEKSDYKNKAELLLNMLQFKG